LPLHGLARRLYRADLPLRHVGAQYATARARVLPLSAREGGTLAGLARSWLSVWVSLAGGASDVMSVRTTAPRGWVRAGLDTAFSTRLGSAMLQCKRGLICCIL